MPCLNPTRTGGRVRKGASIGEVVAEIVTLRCDDRMRMQILTHARGHIPYASPCLLLPDMKAGKIRLQPGNLAATEKSLR
jgi:hypothetical protein